MARMIYIEWTLERGLQLMVLRCTPSILSMTQMVCIERTIERALQLMVLSMIRMVRIERTIERAMKLRLLEWKQSLLLYKQEVEGGELRVLGCKLKDAWEGWLGLRSQTNDLEPQPNRLSGHNDSNWHSPRELVRSLPSLLVWDFVILLKSNLWLWSTTY